MRTSGAVHDSTGARRELGGTAHGRTSSTSSTTRPVARAAREERSMPELVDIATVAASLGVGVRHVRRLVAERRIPFVKVGHYVRFDTAELSVWVDDRRVQSLR